MKCLLSVCLISLACMFGVILTRAQQLQKGVSVQMPVTHNATPMPDADYNDAWVIPVTAEGNLFFGAKPQSRAELVETMRATPRNREAKLYIKADARASFASLRQALDAARADGFETVVLLTAQHDSAAPGVMMPPKGFEVSLAAPASSTVVVEIRGSTQQQAALLVNNEELALANLPGKLAQNLEGRTDKSVVISAHRQVAFAQLAQVLDACSTAKANISLTTPEL